MASTTGYSGTPLAKKLGFKEGSRVRTSRAPENYLELVSPHPPGVLISNSIRKDIDIWHYFTVSLNQLRRDLPKMQNAIKQNGMIWISWPKKASKVTTDVTEGLIRREALSMKLVDVKVCAVDDVWSGLKLVIRKNLRT